jgi:hypothetical protein
MFFQQLKRVHEDWIGSTPNGEVQCTVLYIRARQCSYDFKTIFFLIL